MGVAIGVDSHKSTLAVAVLDELGRVIGSNEFSNDDSGHGTLLEWIKRHDVERVIGSREPAISEQRWRVGSSKRARTRGRFQPSWRIEKRRGTPPAGNLTSVTRSRSLVWSHVESGSRRRGESMSWAT
jgi:hypothetical protein